MLKIQNIEKIVGIEYFYPPYPSVNNTFSPTCCNSITSAAEMDYNYTFLLYVTAASAAAKSYYISLSRDPLPHQLSPIVQYSVRITPINELQPVWMFLLPATAVNSPLVMLRKFSEQVFSLEQTLLSSNRLSSNTITHGVFSPVHNIYIDGATKPSSVIPPSDAAAKV